MFLFYDKFSKIKAKHSTLFQFLQYSAVMQNGDHGWMLMLLVIFLLLGMVCGGIFYRRLRPPKLSVKDISENPGYPDVASKCAVS